MCNDSSREKLTVEINNAGKAYSEIETLNKYLSKFKTIQNQINMPTRGRGKFKNLYWWAINLENEVDIYSKYNKFFFNAIYFWTYRR